MIARLGEIARKGQPAGSDDDRHLALPCAALGRQYAYIVFLTRFTRHSASINLAFPDTRGIMPMGSWGSDMHSDAQTIARLKSMVFLIEEALRIADAGDNPLIGAKLSDCIDCLQNALTQIDSLSSARLDSLSG